MLNIRTVLEPTLFMGNYDLKTEFKLADLGSNNNHESVNESACCASDIPLRS